MNEQSLREALAALGRWREWIVLGALAVVLSLIGFGVASSVGPASSPAEPTTPVAAPGPDSTAPTTAGLVASAGEPGGEGEGAEATTTTTEAPAEPASLGLSSSAVDFGADGDAVELQVTHNGGGAASWALASGHAGVSVSPAEGDVSPGETDTVTVRLDRSQMEEGALESSLQLTWDAGEAEASVTAVHEDNPIIHNPQVSPGTLETGGDGCSPTRATVSARVRDTSELERVIARWSHDGSSTRETTLEPVGEDRFEGTIGPYEADGSDSVKVVAFDVRGNAGGASVAVTVVPCD